MKPLEVNGPLSFDHTVSRRLVHKKEISEVFLTDSCQGVGDTFVLGALWPRSHSFYQQDSASYDSLLIAETVRQATILVGHQFFDIPLDCRFVINDMFVQVIQKRGRNSGEPTPIVLHANARNIRRRGGRVTEWRMNVSFHAGETLIAHAGGGLQVYRPNGYARLRGNTPTMTFDNIYSNSPLIEATSDSVLSSSKRLATWSLSISAAHPVFFDHPIDHVPGMLIPEAARQAGRIYTGCIDGDFSQFAVEYTAFLELNQPVYITLDEADETLPNVVSLHFSVWQNEKKAVTLQTKMGSITS
jgi:hypothetical protein